jgi:hypothetical protein
LSSTPQSARPAPFRRARSSKSHLVSWPRLF